MAQVVPPTTRIRTRSVPNVDTARLFARLEFLRDYLTQSATWSNDSRKHFRERVVETVNIERELLKRGVMFRPVTDGAHLRKVVR